jgi:sialidase-1
MEPTLVELADGSILMHLRTDLGSTYRSRSTDEGITWAPPEPTSLRNPESASALAGIPATSDLLTLYNDNYDPDGPHHEGARTPLTAAVSNDEGRTWRVTKNVESDLAFEYSYPSITFVEDRALFTYYEASQADGEWSYDQIFRSASLRWLYGECGGSP